MDYEEIKQKYAGQMAEDAKAVEMARSRVERLEMQLQHLTAEREQYRQGNAAINADTAYLWREYTSQINHTNKELSKAREALSSAELGTEGNRQLNKAIDLLTR